MCTFLLSLYGHDEILWYRTSSNDPAEPQHASNRLSFARGITQTTSLSGEDFLDWCMHVPFRVNELLTLEYQGSVSRRTKFWQR